MHRILHRHQRWAQDSSQAELMVVNPRLWPLRVRAWYRPGPDFLWEPVTDVPALIERMSQGGEAR